jgi:protein CpxP
MEMGSNLKKVIVLAVMLVFAGIVSAPVYAGDEGCCKGPRHHGPCCKHMWKKLGLSDQQKKQIKEIFEKDRTACKPVMEKLFTERKALMSLEQASPVDEAAIRAQAGKVASVEADLAVMRAKVGEQVRKVLTAEQNKKLQEIRQKQESRCEKSGPPGPGPRKGCLGKEEK